MRAGGEEQGPHGGVVKFAHVVTLMIRNGAAKLSRGISKKV
jgi:hypothetical protein